MTTLFERAIDAHQDPLDLCALLASIGVTVLANDHRRTDSPFGEIVVKGDARLVEEREQVVAMTPQALDQPLRLRILPRRGNQFVQTLVQSLPTRLTTRGRKLRRPPQTNRIAHQTSQLLGKLRPVFSSLLVVIHRVQVAEQVNQAALSGCADHGIVSAPEIADQRSLEFLHEELWSLKTSTICERVLPNP